MARPKKEKEAEKTSEENSVLGATLQSICKKYGKGSIMLLDSEEEIEDVPVISTGSFLLDKALGIGGLPKGRIVEIYGGESVGKTTLALKIISEAQKQGEYCAYIDMEHALDKKWAKKMGVQFSKTMLTQPSCGEEAIDIAEDLLRSGQVAVIVIDSVSSLTPKAEMEGEITEANIGLQARLMSKAMRKLSPLVSGSNTLVIFINQIRMKIGVMFGNPETTSGGNALKFFSSIRIELRKSSPIVENNATIGMGIKAKIVKNKMAPPLNVCEMQLMFDNGFSLYREVVDDLINNGQIIKSGSWLGYKNQNLGQGVAKVIQAMNENESLAKELVELAKVGGVLGAVAGEVE